MTTLASKTRVIWQRISTAQSFGSHVIITIGTNILMACIALLTGTLAARILGPEGRGQLAAIQTWPIFFAEIALWGLPEAVVYFTAKNPREAGQYTASATVLALILAFPLLGLAYVLMPLLLSAQSSQVIFFARWHLLYIFSNILLTVQRSPIQGKNNFWVWNLLRPMPNLAWLIVLLVAMIEGIQTPQWVAFAYLLLLSLLFFPRHYVIKKQVASPMWPPKIEHWRPLLGYGFPLVLSTIPLALNLRLDQMLMVTMLPAQIVGYYVIAVAWSAALSPLVNAIGMVLFPHTANASNLEQKTTHLKRGVHITIIVAVGVSLPVLGLTSVAVPLLFGEEFSPAIPAAYILVIAGMFLSLKGVLQEGLRGLGETKLILWGECVGLIITTTLLFVTLPLWGIIGAAITSVLAYALTAFFYLHSIAQLTNHKFSAFLLLDKEEWVELRTYLFNLSRQGLDNSVNFKDITYE